MNCHRCILEESDPELYDTKGNQAGVFLKDGASWCKKHYSLSLEELQAKMEAYIRTMQASLE